MKISRFALFAVLLSLATLPLFAAQEGSFDRTLKVSGQVDLDVSTGSGSITVNRGSDGQVVIHATIRASNYGWFGGDVSDKIRAIESKVAAAGIHLTLLDRAGVRLDSFADSTGKLIELEEPATL